MGQLEQDIETLTEAFSKTVLDDSVNVIMERLSLNLSISRKNMKEIKPLLHSIKRVLAEYDGEDLDFSLLLNLLDHAIRVCPFEEVLTVFSVEDLTNALTSQIDGLMKSVCKVIGAARPKNIFAGSVVLDKLLAVFFNVSTDVDVVNEIENILPILLTDELNRRRLLENNLPVLLNTKFSEDSSSFCRLLDLLVVLFENISFEEFREDLFLLEEDTIRKAIEEDILVFIHICKYYTALLTIVKSTDSKNWSIRYLIPAFVLFGECFAKRDVYEDIRHFGKTYLLQLFSKVSYLDDLSILRELERNYFPLSNAFSYTSEFLTVINPKYVSIYHQDIIRDLKLSARTVEIYRNLFGDETSFNLLKCQLVSASLLKMPYLEQLYILEGLTSYPYGIHHLTHEMPMVMNHIIETNATERTCFKLRLKVFENLLEANPQELSIWLIPLQSEYANILSGKPSQHRAHDIANEYL